MIRIGTRSSPMAVVQAQIVPMTTTGDNIKDVRLTDFGGKGLFTKEIEEALLRREVDIAVHSMKDVATKLPDGLIIPSCLPRDDVRDAWVSTVADHPKDLPAGSRVGTSSLRRAAQVLHLNPNLEVVTLRGNVQTRLSKIAEGHADGTFLAYAGLQRLAVEKVATHIMSVDEMVPAPAQGALGLQCRQDDLNMLMILDKLDHEETRHRIEIERSFLRGLDGSCRTPIAALVTVENDQWHFTGLISDSMGKHVVRETFSGIESEVRQKVVDLASLWRKEHGALIGGELT